MLVELELQQGRACASRYAAQERHHMSLRNGDRSRENRLRRARIARRLKSQQLRQSPAKPSAPATPGK